MNGPAEFGFGGGFEGSFGGDTARIGPRAMLECKICWFVYDPAIGDDTRQVEPGTAFRDLPHDWTCPECGGAPEQFMVLRDPDAEADRRQAGIDAAAARLEADFLEVWNGKMRDVPLVNPLLQVQAVGFRPHGEGALGVLVAPWFMNLILLPGEDEDWSSLRAGDKEIVSFPSGDYEFLHNTRETVGGYKACSLFSPMGDFRSHAKAVEVAEAVMTALFDAGNRAETDRQADIRAAREAEIAERQAASEAARAEAVRDAGTEPALSDAPTRRALISGGLAGGEDAAR